MICLKVILILNNLLDDGKANMETWMSQTCKKIVTEIKLKIVFNINYDTCDPNPPGGKTASSNMFAFISFQ